MARLAQDPDHPGVVHALEAGELGMYVHQVLPRKTRFEFRLVRDGADDIALFAEVKWSKPLSEAYCPGCRFELRVALVDPPAAYAELLTELHERRRDERFKAAVPVEFIEPPGIAPALTRNIAEGGAYIEACDGLEPGMVAAVRVALPGVPARIYALGQVVRVDDDAIGLKFLDFHSGNEGRLSDYLAEFTDTHGEPIMAMPKSDLRSRSRK